MNRQYSSKHLKIHLAISVSSHIISKHQSGCSTGSQTCPCNNTAFIYPRNVIDFSRLVEKSHLDFLLLSATCNSILEGDTLLSTMSMICLPAIEYFWLVSMSCRDFSSIRKKILWSSALVVFQTCWCCLCYVFVNFLE